MRICDNTDTINKQTVDCGVFMFEKVLNNRRTGRFLFRLVWLLLALMPAFSAVADAPVRWRGFNLDGKAIKGAFSGVWLEEDLALMRELGFNFARVMVDYRYFCRPGTYEADPALFAPIDEVIGWGRKHDIHTQICFSIPPGVDYAVTRSKKAMLEDAAAIAGNVACWTFFANRYREVPASELSFNLFNEPTPDCSESAYVSFIRACERAIHAVSPERLVIADGIETARLPISGADDLPVGQSLHIYTPMGISHYRAPWCKTLMTMFEPVWPPAPVTSPVYGSWKRDVQEPIVLLDVPSAELEVVPGIVNRLTELVVKADGREIGRVRYCPAAAAPGYSNLVARSGNAWAGVPVRPFVVDVPAAKRLEIGLDEGDWMEIGEIALSAQGRRASLGVFPLWRTTPREPTPVRFAGFDAATPFVRADGRAPNGTDFMDAHVFAPWERLFASGRFVMVGETGVYNETPHAVALAWLEDVLRGLKARNVGWALWNFRGAFGILDSGRKDVAYEDFHGHKLDRKMLELLQRY